MGGGEGRRYDGVVEIPSRPNGGQQQNITVDSGAVSGMWEKHTTSVGQEPLTIPPQ